MRLSPAVVLEELLRYRSSSLQDTKWFESQKHNETLCPAVNDRVIEILDCFVKYHAISYDVQGLRDQGVDVVLQYNAGGDDATMDRIVAIQVKSFSEFARGGMARDLKAQFVDARRRYGEHLERYYVMLCTNARVHADRVRDISAELIAERQIRIIEPRYAFTFLHLPATAVAGTVDRLLRDEDSVHKAARDEVADLTPLGLAIVLDALVFDRSSLELEQSATHPSDAVVRVASSHFDVAEASEALARTYAELDDSVFGRSATGWELQSSYFRALRCILLYAEIRFGYLATELFEYMFETFHRSALASLDNSSDD